jgi:formylglycine-generating enzyme required for sulfatase activity
MTYVDPVKGLVEKTPHLPSGVTNTIGKGEDYPVYYVSWYDIDTIFLPRLNKITGLKFRLPTEAEWEYAARGGNITPKNCGFPGGCPYCEGHGCVYSGGDTLNKVAWHKDYSGIKAHTVGELTPNELGLFDMSGNIRELCLDRWNGSTDYSSGIQTDPVGSSGSFGMWRGGGGFTDVTNNLRVAYRSDADLTYGTADLGFRLVLVP